jgi:hypothetical protein
VIVTEIEGILRRFAIIWSAVAAFVVLVLMSVAIEIISVTDDTDTTTWATVLVFVGIAYAVVASWLIRHHYGCTSPGQHRPPLQLGELSFAGRPHVGICWCGVLGHVGCSDRERASVWVVGMDDSNGNPHDVIFFQIAFPCA